MLFSWTQKDNGQALKHSFVSKQHGLVNFIEIFGTRVARENRLVTCPLPRLALESMIPKGSSLLATALRLNSLHRECLKKLNHMPCNIHSVYVAPVVDLGSPVLGCP
jgi:hypothetical protein